MRLFKILKRQVDAAIYGLVGPFAVLYVFPKSFLSLENNLNLGIEKIKAFEILGSILMNLGGLLAIWCAIIMITSRKASPSPFSLPQKIVSKGPYKVVRHPMMWALHITLLGEVFIWLSPFLLLWLLIWIRFATIYIAKLEEPYLIHLFGREYIDYCKKVPRWFPKKREKINL